MSDKQRALFQHSCEIRKRQIQRERRGRVPQRFAQRRHSIFIGFTANDEQRGDVSGSDQPFTELLPFLDWPVLRRAAAAGMDGCNCLHLSTEEIARKLAIFRRRIQTRGRIKQRQTKFVQRLR
jgi:hypothetical protein